MFNSNSSSTLGFINLENKKDQLLLQDINYTIFNYEKCKVVSSKLYKVTSINIFTTPSLWRLHVFKLRSPGL